MKKKHGLLVTVHRFIIDDIIITGISTRTHLIELQPTLKIVYSRASGILLLGFGVVDATASAAMLQALRDLATAKKEGLLSDEEYERQHAALLSGEQRWGTSPAPDRLAAMESKLDQLAERLIPPRTTQLKTASTACMWTSGLQWWSQLPGIPLWDILLSFVDSVSLDATLLGLAVLTWLRRANTDQWVTPPLPVC